MRLKNRIKFFKRIGFKITLWYSLSVLVISVLAGSFLYYRLRHKLEKEVRGLLLDECHDIMQPILAGNFNLEDMRDAIERESSSRKFHKISARLLDARQNVLISSANFIDPFLKIPEKIYENAKNDKETFTIVRIKGSKSPYLLLTKPAFLNGSAEYLLQMAISLRASCKASENFLENVITAIPGIIIITIAGGWFIAKKSLSPVEEITKAAQNITALSLNTRLKSINTGDELDELTNTINLMLNRLDDSFKRIVQFTSDVSHELRTPIATLRAGTEVMLAKDRKPEVYRELLENNLGEYEKITRMIEDLLVILKSDSGTKVLHLKIFSLSNMLKELGNTFGLISEVKNINFDINKISDLKINGDEMLLRRVFSNLLDNAVKYTNPGGNIRLMLESADGKALVSIKDTGIGISEDQKGLVFDRFFRADPSRSRETGGAGLGLSICKNIVELHNGKIEVKSTLGAGSTFIVTLPKNHLNS